MDLEDLRVGLVIQPDWDSRPLRILAFDRIEVLYDCWWPAVGGWGMRDLRGTYHYYRTSTELVLTRAAALRLDPLTQAEVAVHRPDLPLRLLRLAELEWSDAVASSMGAFLAWVSARMRGQSLTQTALDIAAVGLVPYGAKGGMRKPIQFTASNGREFSSLELMWRAASIQAPIASRLRHGVGLYRLGCAAGRPLFYLWGFYDRAGLIPRDGGDA